MRKVNRNSKINKTRSFNRTVGCDVDSEIVVIATFDRNSDEFETKEFQNTFDGALKAVDYISEFKPEAIIMESTSTYHIIFHEVFKAKGLPVAVINPTKISKLLKSVGKNDKADARNMALLAASFDLKVSNMPNLMQKEIRELTHRLDKLKAELTKASNSLNTKLTSYGCNIFRKVKVNSKSGLAMVRGIIDGKSKHEIFEHCWFGTNKNLDQLWELFGNRELIPEFIYPTLEQHWENIIYLNSQIENVEKECLDLIDKLELRSLIDLMTTVPFINEMLALRFIGEMGEDFPNRYPNPEAFCKALGVVPSNEVSGGKVLKKSQEKGNRHIKIPFLNTIKPYVVSKSYEYPWKQFFKDYWKRRGFLRAISAMARKSATALYAVVRDKKPFDPEHRFEFRKPKVYLIKDTPVKF